MKILRRRFIRNAAAVLAIAPFISRRSTYAQDLEPPVEPARRPYGRAIYAGLAVRDYPSTQGTLLRRLRQNDVVQVLGQVVGEGPTEYNPIWYRIPDGFVHSGFLQPAENILNKPLEAVALEGEWGEITVPFSEARSRTDIKSSLVARYYFGCVIRINEIVTGTNDTPWYRISEGDDNSIAFLQAEHVRPILPDEILPISQNAPHHAKRIEVDLKKQISTAFEYDQPVFSARVSTGAVLTLSDGTVIDGRTDIGEHNVFLKILGQRMNGGSAGDANYYNLPGVSWVSYFTGGGIAFHGTYWHNDYGRPRSRGCVNMLPEDAKWVFRWTQPSVDLGNRWTRIEKRVEGTQVIVF